MWNWLCCTAREQSESGLIFLAGSEVIGDIVHKEGLVRAMEFEILEATD